MTINLISPDPRIRLSAAIALGLSAAILLGGCDLQRQSQSNQPGGQGEPATQAVVQPTPVLGPTDNAPATPEVSEPTSNAPDNTAVVPASTPAIEATSETDTLGDQVDQDLQQLDDLNKSTDPLDDNP